MQRPCLVPRCDQCEQWGVGAGFRCGGSRQSLLLLQESLSDPRDLPVWP